MAPAVCRMMAAIPSANSPSTVRKRPPPTTARSTSGCDSDAVGAEPDKSAWPRKNEREGDDLATPPGPAPRTRPPWRRAAPAGAARLPATARMAPAPYSALTVSTPKHAHGELAEIEPVRLMLVGSNSALSTKPALRKSRPRSRWRGRTIRCRPQRWRPRTTRGTHRAQLGPLRSQRTGEAVVAGRQRAGHWRDGEPSAGASRWWWRSQRPRPGTPRSRG